MSGSNLQNGHIHTASAAPFLVFVGLAHATTGDMVSVTIPGQSLVILNSLKAAVDLLEKRSAIYSDRPDLLMAGRMVGWNETLVLTPAGERFRAMRRQLHQFIGSRQHMVKFHGLQVQETRHFLRRLLRDPAHFADHIRK